MICKHHNELCEPPEKNVGKKLGQCAGCGNKAFKVANFKISVAVTQSKKKKVTLGEPVCVPCSGIQLEDSEGFYYHMQEEHKVALLSEENKAGDESLMDIDPRTAEEEEAVDFSDLSDSEEIIPFSQDSAEGTDWKLEWLREHTNKTLKLIQDIFPEMKIPNNPFYPEKIKSKRHMNRYRAGIQSMIEAVSKMMFPESEAKTALNLMQKGFEGYKDRVEQGSKSAL